MPSIPRGGSDIRLFATSREFLRSRWVALIALALGGLLAVRQVWIAWQSRVPLAVVDSPDRGMVDFRDTAVLPNRAIAAGVNPYDGQWYSTLFPFAQEFDAYAPWWLTATYPFSLLDWDTATLIWAIVCMLGYLGAALYLARLVNATAWGTRLPALTVAAISVLLVVLWRVTAISLGLGNIGSLVAMAAALALLSWNLWVGSIFLAIAWIKPQFGIPVTIALLCLPGRARMALGGVALATAASIPATILTSQVAGGFGKLIESVLRTAREVGAGDHSTALDTRIDLAGKLELVAPQVPMPLTFAIGLIGVAASALLARRLTRSGNAELTPLLVGSAVLVLIPHFVYDLAILLPVGAYAAAALLGRDLARRDYVLLGTLAIAAIIGLIPGMAIHDGNEAAYSLAAAAVFLVTVGWAIATLRQPAPTAAVS